jgi:CubicO group peptidase (beta-lactamase class C family)
MCFVLLLVPAGCKKGLNNEPSPPPDPDYPDVPAPGYWPTAGWQSASPESQGMDSGRLADLLEHIKTQNYPIRSVLVIRKGYLVTEAYFLPFREGLWHIIHSCTKSILSTLTGIAIEKGQLAGDQLNILDFFPEYNAANNNAWKQSLELRHLLMMATGMEARDSYLYEWEGLDNMRASADWVKYMLDLPMINAPGSTFDYSNGSSFLIAAILQKAVQMDGLEYAFQHLFNHLGISRDNVDWPMNPQGIVYGWGQMRLRPADMAKFGFLYLHKGNWEGNQLVSRDWVRSATRPQIQAGTAAENYGYQWWMGNQGYFWALGYSGQYIIVHPEQNLVTVFSSALPENNANIPETLYNNYILDAIRSGEAIAEDAQKKERLDNIIHDIATPVPEPVPALPAMAAAISGNIYTFDANEYDYKHIGLTFTPGSDEALFSFAFRDRDLQLPVGLDNVYRATFQFDYWRCYKGRWEDADTFVMDYQLADYSEYGALRLTFSGANFTLVFISGRSGNERTFTGHI